MSTRKETALTPEKKEEYKRAMRSKFAAERERRKAAGEKTPERLMFLYKIFSWMGLTYKDVADLSKSSAQNVIYHMTITDDGKLSWVEKIFTSLGLTYKISFDNIPTIDEVEIREMEERGHTIVPLTTE